MQGSKERRNKSDDVIRCKTRSDAKSQVSEASKEEFHSRSSDSGQNCKYQRHLNIQEITSEASFSRYIKTLIRIVNHDEVTFKPS